MLDYLSRSHASHGVLSVWCKQPSSIRWMANRQALQDSLRSYSATQPEGSQNGNPPREVPFGTRQGRIWCGEGHDSGGIEVGYFRDPNTERPLYLSDAQLSVLGDLLTDTVVQGVDLKPHIAEAKESISSNISFAYGHLQHCGFGYEEVKELLRHELREWPHDSRRSSVL